MYQKRGQCKGLALESVERELPCAWPTGRKMRGVCGGWEVRAAGMVQGEMLVAWIRVARVEVGNHGLFCVCMCSLEILY